MDRSRRRRAVHGFSVGWVWSTTAKVLKIWKGYVNAFKARLYKIRLHQGVKFVSWTGSGPKFSICSGLGWVGSRKTDLWTTLRMMLSGGNARNHALDEGAHWRHLANTILIVPCAPAMRPCVILLAQWPPATNTDTVWRQKYNLLFDKRRAVLS